MREFAKAYGLVRPKTSDDGENGRFRNPGKRKDDGTSHEVKASQSTARTVETETQPALWDDEEINPS